MEKTLREALDSFLVPEVREAVEVLIIDDGSADSTPEIGREYAERYPETFRLISKENGGWGSALNTAIDAASGKYFKHLDGDDYYLADNLPGFLSLLEQTDADLIWTAFGIFEDETGGVICVESRFREFAVIDRTVGMENMEYYIPAIHSITVKTDVLKSSGIRMTEHCFFTTDLEFVIKVYNSCRTFTCWELPVYMHRVGSDGQIMSIAGIRRHYRDHQTILLNCLDYWKQHVTEPVKKEVLRRRLEKACTMQYMFYFALECTGSQKKELMEFDRLMQEKYPEFMQDMEGGKRLKILRKIHFTGYRILGRQNTRKDRRLRRHIFEKI